MGLTSLQERNLLDALVILSMIEESVGHPHIERAAIDALDAGELPSDSVIIRRICREED